MKCYIHEEGPGWRKATILRCFNNEKAYVHFIEPESVEVVLHDYKVRFTSTECLEVDGYTESPDDGLYEKRSFIVKPGWRNPNS